MKKSLRFFGSPIRVTALLAAAVLAAAASGCATTVSFQTQRPPTLNTLGIRRLAVMPFTAMNNSPMQRQAAGFLTNETLIRLQSLNRFTLVSSAEIDRVRGRGGDMEALADALFNGQVTDASITDRLEQNSYKDKDGNTVTITTHYREAELSFNYSLTRTRDGSLLGPLTKSYQSQASSENPNELPAPDVMMRNLVQQNLYGIGRDVAPYTVTERRNLMKETSKDKEVKQQAKDAAALVKEGSYRSAQEAFLSIYRDTGSFPSAYNAALLLEVQGNLEGAASFMRQVYMETGNPRAQTEENRLQRAMENVGLLEAYRTNARARDRVIAAMVATLPSKLPERPRAAVINNSRQERELAEEAVNGIIDGLVAKGITVVDRNNRALTEMERQYQYAGNVNDDEMVRLGREAGINVFIIIAVNGQGGGRHLSARVIDVERNIILYQSPQTPDMNL